MSMSLLSKHLKLTVIMDKQNLTFNDLNELVDRWIMDTIDIHGTFCNQADEVKRLFLDVGKGHSQLEQINAWINLLRYYDKRVDADVEVITQKLSLLENIINTLEEKLPDIEDIRMVDPSRASLFDVFDSVFASIQQLREFNEINCKSVCQIEEENLKNPAEQLGKIMMNHLQTLEEIEVKLYKMMTCIANIETKTNFILQTPKIILRNPCQ